jgi:hypothetical protein
MRNKSLIFLALIVLGVVGCNKEATNAKETEGTKDVVNAASAVVEQQNKEIPATGVAASTASKPATSK